MLCFNGRSQYGHILWELVSATFRECTLRAFDGGGSVKWVQVSIFQGSQHDLEHMRMSELPWVQSWSE